ncbi:MAG: hypothetical protein JWN44_1847 [Myxococcales bacterium]|nr:hypothetical protein [Myxococcales bacterium]
MGSRAAAMDKIVKILRLARGAGTEGEAQAALLHAQRLMYAHDIAEDELVDGSDAPITDLVIDHFGHSVPWKEYLAAVIAENFRCAYIISRARSGGLVRFVLVGRGDDCMVAGEAYQAAAIAAENLSAQFASTREDVELARASYLTGFIKGLYERFQENVSATALVVVTAEAVMAHARGLTNAGDAAGGGLPRGDAEATAEGYQTGWAFGSNKRTLSE